MKAREILDGLSNERWLSRTGRNFYRQRRIIQCRDGSVSYWPEGNGYHMYSPLQRGRAYSLDEWREVLKAAIQELGGEVRQ